MSTTTDRHAKAVRQPFLHLPVPWMFVLAYLVGMGLQLLVPINLGSPALSVLARVAGAVLFVVGASIAGWGLIIFRRTETTTVPGEAPRKLVTHGPHRFTRNPMYVGLVLAYLGEEGLLVQAWPLVLLVLTIGYVNGFVIPVEEASLGAFGEAYERYRTRVRRWL